MIELKKSCVFGLSFLLLCGACTTVNAQEKTTPETTQSLVIQAQAEEEAVKQAEKYLNSIKNIKAKFIITSGNGHAATGDFYLQRPGRLRFQYDKPNGDYIVGDGFQVHYWDDTDKQHNSAPIGATIADFILRDNITLHDDVMVTRVEDIKGYLAITVIQTNDPGTGELTFLFARNPWKLVKWRIVDSMGNITETTLTKHTFPKKLDPRLFVFKPPKGYEDVTEMR